MTAARATGRCTLAWAATIMSFVGIQPEHRSLLGVDVEGFSRLERTDPIRLRVHRLLRDLLMGALGRAGADPSQYDLSDTGDGFLATISPSVPKNRLLDPLVGWLAERLHHHNQAVGEAERVRLRVVVHAGEVLRDPQPNVGHTAIFASRLLDAAQLRACLAATHAPLVLGVSDWIYQEVVQHRYGGVDPAGYQPVRVTAKGVDALAWVHVPGDRDAVERAGLLAAGTARSPYPGLEAFTEDDAEVFFGREPAVATLLDRLHPVLPRDAHRFVAVIGPSGAGKSSLVQAGLLPRLAGQRQRWLVVPPMLPEDQPTRNLARSLAAACGREAAPLAAELAKDPAALVRCCEQLRVLHDDRSALVLLVVDQAEELLTLSGQRERAGFLALLRGALEADPGLWVLATLRSEFLTGFLTSGFAALFQNPVVVGSLDRTALFEVVQKPAARVGLAFDPPTLVSTIVDDTGGGDALPLVAYTLQALYLEAGPGGTVTAEAYRRLGGVAGALAKQADKVSAELRAKDPGSPVLDTLLRFVTLDEADPTRRRVRRDTLDEAQRRVVDAFVAARVLTSDTAGDEVVVGVAHEALFRQWAPLRQAIEARADELRWRADLERWAQDWDRSGRQDAYLLRDERLVRAQRWAAAHAEAAAGFPLLWEFLDRSRRFDVAALERLADAVARRALATVELDPELGLLLALAAIEDCVATPLAHRALLAALGAARVRRVLHGHEEAVRSVAWSPDGRRVATASYDGTARIWAAEHGTQLAVLRGHDRGVSAVAWSPDGRRIATVSNDRTGRLWDADDGTMLASLHGHQDWVQGVAWSPDGQRLATASSDRTARLWDAEVGTELVVLRGHEDGLRSVAWSPDGQRIATGSYDRTGRLWDAEAGSELTVLRGHLFWVLAVVWSTDGQRIATASADRTARIWDAASGTQLATLHGHKANVDAVAWSPDGRRIASASGDRTVRTWDAETGTELAVLPGPGAWLPGVAWSPDGRRLAVASDDATARIWIASDGTELAAARGHEDVVHGVAWSPDGQRIATASGDRTARVWDATTGTELAILHGHANLVHSVAWAPDGQRIATASNDRTARVWDATIGTELAVLHGHEDVVQGAAWSPDGERIATASHDRTARVWDPRTGTELGLLCVHEDWVEAVAWSPDGERIATASRDRTARVWDAGTNLDALLAKAHARVLRELTDEERRSAMLPGWR